MPQRTRFPPRSHAGSGEPTDGLPEAHAEVFADADQGIAEGHLYTESNDLHRLIGRSTTPLEEAVPAARD